MVCTHRERVFSLSLSPYRPFHLSMLPCRRAHMPLGRTGHIEQFTASKPLFLEPRTSRRQHRLRVNAGEAAGPAQHRNCSIPLLHSTCVCRMKLGGSRSRGRFGVPEASTRMLSASTRALQHETVWRCPDDLPIGSRWQSVVCACSFH